ncbi:MULTISPECIES: LysR family transcriptional regulator [Devosia]|uniref:LysR family transcriptional regulator n=1 Tax=Devosia TaxID=46913 RepID=UPI002736FCB3|nr:LysR family transcriptional regulator [Devosia sp.]MDP2779949.1 LysR family transcriptional regulator [Devosia sp.]HLV83378.1 LysR family transcriptional regulator [Devosia sp.]
MVKSDRGSALRILDMVTFIALARHRHFGRAAAELHTTQPAISIRLAAMEEEFGCRLIDRTGRKFSLTPGGQKVLDTFQAILSSYEGLKSELADDTALTPKVVRIGAIDSVSATWMTPFVEALHEAAPTLKIELTVEGTKNLIDGMNKGEFDVIFALDPAIGDDFRSFTSCVLQMTWAGSPKIIDPDRSYSVDDLASLPIITFPKNTPPYRMIAPYFQDEQVLASKLTSSNSLYSIISLLIDGFGVGAIPTVTIRRELKMGLLHPIRVAKHFPAMPIIGSYQAISEKDLIRRVVEQAHRSATLYCATVDPSMAWVE